jgi:hypothetical protein
VSQQEDDRMTPLVSGMLLCVLVLSTVLLLAYGQLKQVEATARRHGMARMSNWEPMMTTLRTLPPSSRELEAARPPLYPTDSASGKGTDAVLMPSIPWWTRAATLERQGYSADQIAQELEIPVPEVQLVLALGYPSRGA